MYSFQLAWVINYIMKDKEMRKKVNDDSISALEKVSNNSDISHTMKVAIDGVSQYHTSLMVLTLT